MRGVTIIRMRGYLWLSTSIDASSSDWAAGIAVVRNTDSPDPSLELDEPWLWYLAGVTSVDVGQITRYEVDTKAKRKFVEGDDELVFQMRNRSVANALNYGFGIRCLFMFP